MIKHRGKNDSFRTFVLPSREQEKSRGVMVREGGRHNNACFVARFGITRETGYEIVVSFPFKGFANQRGMSG